MDSDMNTYLARGLEELRLLPEPTDSATRVQLDLLASIALALASPLAPIPARAIGPRSAPAGSKRAASASADKLARSGDDIADALAGHLQESVDAMVRAQAEVDSLEDPLTKWHYATQLTRFAQDVADHAAQRRAHLAAEIRDSRGLSLSQLAQILGVSKSRASQLVNIASQEQTSTEDI